MQSSSSTNGTNVTTGVSLAKGPQGRGMRPTDTHIEHVRQGAGQAQGQGVSLAKGTGCTCPSDCKCRRMDLYGGGIAPCGCRQHLTSTAPVRVQVSHVRIVHPVQVSSVGDVQGEATGASPQIPPVREQASPTGRVRGGHCSGVTARLGGPEWRSYTGRTVMAPDTGAGDGGAIPVRPLTPAMREALPTIAMGKGQNVATRTGTALVSRGLLDAESATLTPAGYRQAATLWAHAAWKGEPLTIGAECWDCSPWGLYMHAARVRMMSYGGHGKAARAREHAERIEQAADAFIAAGHDPRTPVGDHGFSVGEYVLQAAELGKTDPEDSAPVEAGPQFAAWLAARETAKGAETMTHAERRQAADTLTATGRALMDAIPAQVWGRAIAALPASRDDVRAYWAQHEADPARWPLSYPVGAFLGLPVGEVGGYLCDVAGVDLTATLWTGRVRTSQAIRPATITTDRNGRGVRTFIAGRSLPEACSPRVATLAEALTMVTVVDDGGTDGGTPAPAAPVEPTPTPDADTIRRAMESAHVDAGTKVESVIYDKNATQVARTFAVERHPLDDDARVPCPTCQGNGELAPGEGHNGTETIECPDCHGAGGTDKPDFYELVSTMFGGRLQDVTLSIDNHYYVTLYIEPGRSAESDRAVIDRLAASYGEPA